MDLDTLRQQWRPTPPSLQSWQDSHSYSILSIKKKSDKDISLLNILFNLEDYYEEALVVEALDNISLSIPNTDLVL